MWSRPTWPKASAGGDEDVCWYGTGSSNDRVPTKEVDSAITRSLPLPVPYHSEFASRIIPAGCSSQMAISIAADRLRHLCPQGCGRTRDFLRSLHVASRRPETMKNPGYASLPACRLEEATH